MLTRDEEGSRPCGSSSWKFRVTGVFWPGSWIGVNFAHYWEDFIQDAYRHEFYWQCSRFNHVLILLKLFVVMLFKVLLWN